ncbi:hypothetical protein J6590_046400 [Homalodisca vitripennis]|nr:hypothetical protein J6590_046400 [Homalodisca vitripennis]
MTGLLAEVGREEGGRLIKHTRNAIRDGKNMCHVGLRCRLHSLVWERRDRFSSMLAGKHYLLIDQAHLYFAADHGLASTVTTIHCN